LEIYWNRRMTPSVNSSQGDRSRCPFAKRSAWNPFRRAYPCPFRMNLCNIWVKRLKGLKEEMKTTLREDDHPETDFYYAQQFRIYHEPYLIWDRDTWEAVLTTCAVFRIEVNGEYAGDAIIEDRGRGTKYIVDFSILPEYQEKGIGKQALEQVKKMGKRLTAVTRKEKLGFFLKCEFTLKRTIRHYYDPGINGYYIVWDTSGAERKGTD
jgi:GNAT superfamily N-acetyltransferase